MPPKKKPRPEEGQRMLFAFTQKTVVVLVGLRVKQKFQYPSRLLLQIVMHSHCHRNKMYRQHDIFKLVGSIPTHGSVMRTVLYTANSVGSWNLQTQWCKGQITTERAHWLDMCLAVITSEQWQHPMSKRGCQWLQKKRYPKEEAVQVAMKAVFWLCQESLPLHKYQSLLSFLRLLNVPHIEHLQCGEKTNYSSKTSAHGLLQVLSDIVDENITQKVNESPVITLFTDESTDIVVNHKLAINVRVVDPFTAHSHPNILSFTHTHTNTHAHMLVHTLLDTQMKDT